MGYRIERYHAGLRSRVIALEGHLWSGLPAIDSAYFEWKYEANPCAGEPLLHVAFDGDDAVGVRGWFATRWERTDTGATVDAILGGDSVVTPAHRRRGVFRRINEVAVANLASLGHDFVYNLSAEPVTWHTSMALGWKSPGPFRPLWRRATPGDNPVSEARRREMRSRARVYSSQVPRPEAMAALRGRPTCGARIGSPRDAGWLGWRLRNPRSVYHYVYAEDGGLVGFAIVQTSPGRNDADVRLVDIAASDGDVLAELIDSVVSLTHARALVAWGGALDEATLARLEGHGLRWADDSRGVAGYRPGLLLKALDATLAPDAWRVLDLPALEPGSWRFDMLATDGY